MYGKRRASTQSQNTHTRPGGPRELRLELPRHIATRPRRRRSNRPIAPAAGVESPRLSHKGPSTNWGRRPVGGGGRSCPGRVVAGGGGDAVLQTPSGPFTAVTSPSAVARRGLVGVISSMTGRLGDRLRERPPRSRRVLRLRAAGGGGGVGSHAIRVEVRLTSRVSGCPLGSRVTLSRLGSHDRVASARLPSLSRSRIPSVGPVVSLCGLGSRRGFPCDEVRAPYLSCPGVLSGPGSRSRGSARTTGCCP